MTFEARKCYLLLLTAPSPPPGCENYGGLVYSPSIFYWQASAIVVFPEFRDDTLSSLLVDVVDSQLSRQSHTSTKSSSIGSSA